MTLEGWVHPVFSEVECKALVNFVERQKDLMFMHFAILYGTFETKEGNIVGQKNVKTLIIMYNSFRGREFMEQLANEKGINTDLLVSLSDIKDEELEYINGDIEDELGVGVKIKKADYIPWEDEYDYNTDQIISDFFQGKEVITRLYLSSE